VIEHKVFAASGPVAFVQTCPKYTTQNRENCDSEGTNGQHGEGKVSTVHALSKDARQSESTLIPEAG
jgi:hypothetical protein